MFKRRRGESEDDYRNRMEAYITYAVAFFLILTAMSLHSLSLTIPEQTRQQASNMIGACRHSAQQQASPDVE